MAKNTTPLEEDEQATFVEWLEFQGLKFSSIPNSTYTTSIKQKVKNTKQGLRPGLPDLLIIIPNLGLLFIEMKRQKGSSTSQHQKDWIHELNKLDGIQAKVCFGCDEAIEFVSSILDLFKEK